MITVKYLVCIVFVLLAVINDYKEYKIRNKLILFFLCSGLVLNTVSDGIIGIKDVMLGGLFPLILFPLFMLRMLGAGDIKAFCAIGSILGLNKCIYAIVFSFICGGIIAIIYMLLRNNALVRIRAFINYVKMCFYNRKLLPYSDFTDKYGKFRFAYGILGGVLFTILNSYLSII